MEESEQDRKWLKGQVEKLTLRLREHGVEADGAGASLNKSMEAATLEDAEVVTGEQRGE